MIPPRTLRCANAVLYAGMVLLVWVAVGYVLICKDYGVYGYIGAVLAALGTMLWGGYYMFLRYEVDEKGVSRRLPGSKRRIEWADLTLAELQETNAQGICSVILRLESANAKMELSSSLLPPDSLRDLAQNLSDAGLLTTPLPHPEGDSGEEN